MTEDISRQTIFVLVVLTLLVSVLGTWTVLSHVDAGQTVQSNNIDRVDSGKAVLGIEGPPVRQQNLASGQVVFGIQTPPEE